MAINAKKSACLRIGSRFRHHCNTVSTLDGREIRWEESIRYLGVHIKSAKAFACSLAIMLRNPSTVPLMQCLEKLLALLLKKWLWTVELLKVKCLPVLLHGLGACPISNKQFNSLDFVLKGWFRKIFRTSLLKLCKIVCWYLIACLCRSVLPNVNVNYLQIMLNLITYYAMSVKTLRHMYWIC